MDWTKQFSLLGLSASAKVWTILGAAALAVALAVFGAGTGFGYAWGTGSANDKAAKLAEQVAKEKLAQQTALNAANERNRTREREHDQEVSDLRARLATAEGREQATDARAAADFRSGDDRLRLPVRTCSTAVADAAQSAAARADAEARAELAPETSAALYGIAADGDAAIRQLTGLQEWAESAVKLCGLQPPEGKTP